MQHVTLKEKQYQTWLNRERTAVSIRPATQADAATIATMGYHLVAAAHKGALPSADMNLYLHQAFSFTQINNELAQQDGRFYLAETPQEVVGMVKLNPGSPTNINFGDAPVELSRLYLKQAWIGQGVGTALMQHALAQAIQNQHDVCWLMVWAGNQSALAFYKRWHFTIADSVRYPVGRSSLPAYLMVHRLRA
ncbi:GNAT family N-acetyltransferase [Candidatus Leptofilum sp.]|uniref:GNAT family N-acetyltransferase n=1 Tax=Candidatus Leptofilum sp. TaxID=3241576 RepID=UPI003B5C1F60